MLPNISHLHVYLITFERLVHIHCYSNLLLFPSNIGLANVSSLLDVAS